MESTTTARKKNKFCSATSNAFLSLDQFGVAYQMKLEDGNASVSSPLGAIMSILLFLVLTGFSTSKMIVFLGKKDINILQTTQMHFYDDNYEFNTA